MKLDYKTFNRTLTHGTKLMKSFQYHLTTYYTKNTGKQKSRQTDGQIQPNLPCLGKKNFASLLYFISNKKRLPLNDYLTDCIQA